MGMQYQVSDLGFNGNNTITKAQGVNFENFVTHCDSSNFKMECVGM